MNTIPSAVIHTTFFLSKFEELEDCAANLELLLTIEVEKLNKSMEAQAVNMTLEQKDELYDFASDEFYQLSDSFPQTLRTSMFVHSYSLFEHSLAGLANYLQRKLNLALSPKELKDDGITRSKTYFKKVAKVGFPDNHPTWAHIQILNKIRNFFVHGDGCLPKEGKFINEIENFIQERPTQLRLQGDMRRIQILSHDFIQFVIKTFRDFIKELYSVINASLILQTKKAAV